MQTKAEIETLLRLNKSRLYVYRLHRPDGTPFYVGQGKARRLFFHEQEALGPGLSYKLNTIRRIRKDGKQIWYSVEGFYDSRPECSKREVAEIQHLGRHDLGKGPLTNLTDGGEGAVGLSEETMRRIDVELRSANAPGDRGIANRFFFKLCGEVRSVPIRPAAAFTAQRPLPHRQPRRPTKRMAAALAASAILNRVVLEPGCILPRRMTTPDGARLSIENGAAADILRAGMASLVPGGNKGHESFVVDARGCDLIVQLIGRDLLLDAGILMPGSTESTGGVRKGRK